jgi:F-box and WD-40 domain protein CDC4
VLVFRPHAHWLAPGANTLTRSASFLPTIQTPEAAAAATLKMQQDGYFSPSDSRSPAPGLQTDSDTDMAASTSASSSSMRSSMFASPSHARKQSRLSRSAAPRPILTPSSPGAMGSSLHHTLLPSAPASPPTPAPSPTPTQRAPDWSTAAEHEDSQIKNTRIQFGDMTRAERLRLLGELLNLCDSHELSFVADFVSPRLKKDPFMLLPTELCLRVSPLLPCLIFSF